MVRSIPCPEPRGASTFKRALDYYDRGLWVVPCNGKVPLLKDWPSVRPSKEAVVEAWQKCNHLYIGLVLNQTDWIDIECDTPEAEAKLHAMFGEIPVTPTWESDRGLHRLFLRPPGLPEKATLKIQSIEFRIGNGKGAMSILPPSGKRKWLPDLSLFKIQPAELPDHVAELLRTDAPTSAATRDDSTFHVGERNNELFKVACKLIQAELTVKSVEAVLQVENMSRCKPPLPQAEVASIARSASSQSTQRRQTHAEILLNLALKDSELWHTPDDVPCVTLQRHGHQEHWPLRSKDYSRHLAAVFYAQEDHIVASKTLQDVIDTLEGKAKFDGMTHDRHVRVANHDGRIYIDLVNDEWQAIEVDPTGWRIVNNPPVRFYRSKRALALPMPVQGGTLAELRPFVNVTDECWPLVLGWLIGAFRPDSKYTILKIIGEQGSAKTTTARVLRALTDPNTCPTRGTPRTEQDLMIAAQHNWVCTFDNLSHLSTDLSDALCRLSTGGGFGIRTHYENEEETVFHSTRPTLLNGIEDIGIRSDLMDRALIVELPRIVNKNRKSEKSFYDEFESARPRILGAILDAIVEAMNNLPKVENSKTEWPRMVDFAQWAVAAEPAMGIEPGEFLEAYRENRKSANQVALESSPVASALEELLKRNGEFKGTATLLLGHLIFKQGTNAKDWPKNHRALSGILKRLAPNLRQSGWVVEQDREGNEKLWKIALPKPLPSASSQSTQKNTTVPRPTPGRENHIDAPPQSNVSKKLAEQFLGSQRGFTGE